jgi:tetratricopeptide (TPR) repeat protein
MRLLLPILAISLVALAVACSGDKSGEPAPSPPIATGTDAAESTPTPAATVTQLPLPSPTPSDEPISDTESINHYLRAYALLASGDYDDAERQFTTVVQLEPGFAHGWDGIGQALMFQGEFEEAMYFLDKAIELRPTLATAYSHRALARANLDDSDGALRDAEHALRLDDQQVDPYIVIGRVTAVNGDAARALENFNKAIELSPDDGGAYWWRGRYWRDTGLNFGNALADFTKAIELDPAMASIYLDRAILLLQARVDFAQTRADLDEAISLSQEPRLPRVIERAEDFLAFLDELEAEAATGG